MQDAPGDDFRVALDVADEQLADQLRKNLAFAGVKVTDTEQSPDVWIGDGGRAVKGVPYVVLVDDTLPESELDLPRANLSLNSILAGIALAMSARLVDRDFEYSEYIARYIGVSDAAVATRTLMTRAAARDVTVLITGESGTGKDIVAQGLHLASERRTGPFVPVNCGAIPTELLESELFGHAKGAFTGAITDKVGRFELAHGGTLFLDEIGDMPFALQVKLLRAIEQKSFERVGGTQTKVSDVRIVAATNLDLEQKITSGEFREDLFYRLAVFPIELAPLRERTEDIPLLVNTLVDKIQNEQGLRVRFSIDALACLSGAEWSGNVRELANLLQRLAIEYPNGLVRSCDLPKKYLTPTERAVENPIDVLDGEILLPVNGIDLKEYLARLERSLIRQALDDTNDVVARAADRLHIRRTTLVEKMRKHGLARVSGSTS